VLDLLECLEVYGVPVGHAKLRRIVQVRLR
jgi:hypothetical protein